MKKSSIKPLILIILFLSMDIKSFADGVNQNTCEVNSKNLIDLTPGAVAINITSSPTANKLYTIRNNVTIPTNSIITIDGCEIFMSGNVVQPKIIVQSGAELHIKHSHIFGCDKMWMGIEVQPGGILTIEDNSLIENAVVAINMLPFSSTATTFGNRNLFEIDNSTLNRNNVGINFDGTGSQICENIPVKVNGTVITSRNLPYTAGNFNWPQTSATVGTGYPPLSFPYIRQIGSNFGSPLSSEYIRNNSYPAIAVQTTYNTGPSATIYNKMPEAGIVSTNYRMMNFTPTNVTLINYSLAIETYYYITIGDNDYNIFDHLQNCIKGNYSNFTIYNSIFQNTEINSSNSISGDAIHLSNIGDAEGLLQLLSLNNEYSTGNKFIDCHRAIYTYGYTNLYYDNNQFRSSQSLATDYCLNAHKGKHGIYAYSNFFTTYTITNNVFNNIQYPVFGEFGYIPGGWYVPNTPDRNCNQLFPQINGSFSPGILNINRNIFDYFNANSNPPANQFISECIKVLNTGGIYYDRQLYNIPSLNVNDNQMNNVQRGITISNWRNKKYNVVDNSINLIADTKVCKNYIVLNGHLVTNNVYPPIQYGISSLNNITTPSTVPNNLIQSNTISFIGNHSQLPKALDYGISTISNTQTDFVCNTTTNNQKGIYFNRNCTGTTLNHNTMNNNLTAGLELDNAAVIGQQGTYAKPADNQWTGSFTAPAYKTSTIGGSSAQFSKMYVRNSSNYNPNGSGKTTLAYLKDEYSNIATPPTLLYSNSSAGYTNCPSNGGNGGGAIGKQYIIDILPEWESIINAEAMQNIPNQAEAIFIMQNDIYSMMRGLPTDTILQYTVVDNFLQTNANTSFETLYQLNNQTSLGNYTTVRAILDNFTPANTIEENYKQFYTYAMQMADSSFTDTAGVFALANLCPNTNGNIVYNAQALFMYLNNSNYLFGNTCDTAYYDEDSSMMRMIKFKVKNDFIDRPNNISIYPNPTSGSFTVLIPKGNSDYLINITNNVGQLQFNQIVKNTGIITIQQTLPKGLYFITIKDNITNETTIKKLIIE